MTLCIYIYICICTPVKFKLWNTKDYPCVKLELGQRAISYHTKNVPEQKALKPHRAITIHVRCILLHSQNRLEPMQQWGSLGLGLITNPRFQCCTCTEQLKGLGAWNRNVISDVTCSTKTDGVVCSAYHSCHTISDTRPTAIQLATLTSWDWAWGNWLQSSILTRDIVILQHTTLI